MVRDEITLISATFIPRRKIQDNNIIAQEIIPSMEWKIGIKSMDWFEACDGKSLCQTE